ncbi:MAG: hypothetical protein WBD40_11350 [Tepidisphaeraceae bacterium]
MNRWLLRRLLVSECETLLEALSTRQHLRPHERLADALSCASADLGVCPSAIDAAMRWLDLDPARSIGRLRRTELMQLARSIHRFWRQHAAPQQQPAGQS